MYGTSANWKNRSCGLDIGSTLGVGPDMKPNKFSRTFGVCKPSKIHAKLLWLKRLSHKQPHGFSANAEWLLVQHRPSTKPEGGEPAVDDEKEEASRETDKERESQDDPKVAAGMAQSR